MAAYLPTYAAERHSTCVMGVLNLRSADIRIHKHTAAARRAKAGQYHHHRRPARPPESPHSIPSYPPTKLEPKTTAIYTPVKPHSILG